MTSRNGNLSLQAYLNKVGNELSIFKNAWGCAKIQITGSSSSSASDLISAYLNKKLRQDAKKINYVT